MESLTKLRAELDRLQARAAELEVDAERYRWLRNQSPTYPSGSRRHYMWMGVAYTMHYDEVNERLGEELDAAIDTARKAKP